MSKTKEKLLKVSQVAEMLNVSAETVRQYCRIGRLRSYAMPHYRIPEDEVTRLLKEREVEASEWVD